MNEAATVMFALDSAEELPGLDSSARARIRAARVLLTSKFWLELGDLLDDDEEG